MKTEYLKEILQSKTNAIAEKTTGKFVSFILTCLLLLSSVAAPVMACGGCDPPCTGCKHCIGGRCVRYGDCPCSDCETCQNCWCECYAECGCGGKTCSGCCNCSNCSCVNDNSKCSADKCCDGGTCVKKCNPDGPCYFVWPPVETPFSGCQSGDPTNLSCPPILYGLICSWVQTKAYHLTSAECADCAPGCRTWAGRCVELTPWKCNNDWVPFLGFVCVCNDDLKGDPHDAGDYYECIQ